jgi:methyl-accepting chemotaxis protein
VGAGTGGTNLIKSLSQVEELHIKLVVDKNQDAPGVVLAKQLNIKCASSIDDISSIDVDLILEATGNEKVEELLREKFSNRCKIIDSEGSRLIMTLVKRDIKTLEKLNGQIAAIKSASSAISAQLEEISVTVEGTHKVSEKLIDFTQASTNYIKESDKIIQYVNSIAKQTKILGINATIEAARAGEHGRGFTVVAKEVQKLAESSEGFAKEINSILEKLSQEIQSIRVEVENLKSLSRLQVEASENVHSAVAELSRQVN